MSHGSLPNPEARGQTHGRIKERAKVMAMYRVEFAREWITGRWGFTDRVFRELNGRETEPSRLENAWLIEFSGQPPALGKLLSQRLNIQEKDFRRFGPIFEITLSPINAQRASG